MCSLETVASQTTLLEVILRDRLKADLYYGGTCAIPVFDLTAMHEDSISLRSYMHELSGTDAYWDRKGTLPSSFAQNYLRPRLESLIAGYAKGTYPPGWQVVEGIFPQIGRERVVHLTVLIEPVDGGFRSVYCVSRDRSVVL